MKNYLLGNNLYKYFEPFIKTMSTEELYDLKLSTEIQTYLTVYRINHNLTIKQMSKLLNVSKKNILKWENGFYDFKIKEIVDICIRLNLSFTLNISNTGIDIKFEKDNT